MLWISIIFCYVHSLLASEELSLNMVPQGKIFETRGRTLILRSKAGSKIHIRFNLDGSFKDASGIDLNRGDELEPGEGLLSLSSVALRLKNAGKEPEKIWILEKDQHLGWIYDIQGTLIDAKNGRLISPAQSKKN